MFREDQPKIAEFAWRSPENLARTLLFTRFTVRRHLYDVGPYLDHVEEYGKPACYSDQDAEAFDAIHAGSSYIVSQPWRYRFGGMTLFYEVLSYPGFGIVKAGFAVQLLTGDIGCLDTHNIQRFGLTAKDFSASGSWVTVQGRVRKYVALCQSLGGPEFLWDSWCKYVSALYPKMYPTAQAVSSAHVDAIVR